MADRPSVLVVEDESDLACAIQKGLEADGFRVDIAPDGPSGLARGLSGAVDLIVLDLLLPGLSGFEVCSRLRRAHHQTPILVLTARQGERDETDALETGADDFLTKPFSYPVLLARIRALLRRTATPSDIVESASLVLDVQQRRCWREGTEIALTVREIALLEYLCRHAGHTVTKRELLDEVWDFAFDDGSNIVEVYIGYLRRKVDKPFGRDSIRTIRGVGYRWEDSGD